MAWLASGEAAVEATRFLALVVEERRSLPQSTQPTRFPLRSGGEWDASQKGAVSIFRTHVGGSGGAGC